MYMIPEPIGRDFAILGRRGSNFEGEISPAGTRSAQFAPSSPAVRQILTYNIDPRDPITQIVPSNALIRCITLCGTAPGWAIKGPSGQAFILESIAQGQGGRKVARCRLIGMASAISLRISRW